VLTGWGHRTPSDTTRAFARKRVASGATARGSSHGDRFGPPFESPCEMDGPPQSAKGGGGHHSRNAGKREQAGSVCRIFWVGIARLSPPVGPRARSRGGARLPAEHYGGRRAPLPNLPAPTFRPKSLRACSARRRADGARVSGGEGVSWVGEGRRRPRGTSATFRRNSRAFSRFCRAFWGTLGGCSLAAF